MDIRPLNPSLDAPRMAQIMNAYTPGAFSAETLARQLQMPVRPGAILYRSVAVTPDGRLAGWNLANSTPMAGPGRFLIRVFVDPALCGQGIGSALYEDAAAFAREHGAYRFDHDMPDDRPDALRFAQHRGFVIDRHLCNAVLDLSSFDEAPFAGAVTAAEARGIRFATLAELGDVRRLWQLENEINADIPGYDTQGKEVPFDEYKEFFLDQPWFKPELQILALEGDRWVGLATLRPQGEGSFYHCLTGVVRSHRGLGLGLALKLMAIRTARQHGARLMETENDSLNAPVLGLNRKLGYVAQPGRYLLIRTL
jgi:GNAT superfamily N-acetyltransferase